MSLKLEATDTEISTLADDVEPICGCAASGAVSSHPAAAAIDRACQVPLSRLPVGVNLLETLDSQQTDLARFIPFEISRSSQGLVASSSAMDASARFEKWADKARYLPKIAEI